MGVLLPLRLEVRCSIQLSYWRVTVLGYCTRFRTSIGTVHDALDTGLRSNWLRATLDVVGRHAARRAPRQPRPAWLVGAPGCCIRSRCGPHSGNLDLWNAMAIGPCSRHVRRMFRTVSDR